VFHIRRLLLLLLTLLHSSVKDTAMNYCLFLSFFSESFRAQLLEKQIQSEFEQKCNNRCSAVHERFPDSIHIGSLDIRKRRLDAYSGRFQSDTARIEI